MFLVPYNKLSDEQKVIIRRVSRQDGDLFIEGPPGSGKTLISLYTLKNLISEQSIRPLLVIYNHSLYGYLSTAIKELGISDNITIVTKDKFFWDLAKSHNIRAYGGSYNDKYNRLLDRLNALDLETRFDIAIIDEVQDLYHAEWELFNKLSKQVTSLGDFDQGIYKTDLTKHTVTSKAKVEKLTDIFRFHKNIAKIAQVFSQNKEKLERKVSRIEQKDVQLIDIERYDELDTIAEILKSIQHQPGRIGIISHDRNRLSLLKEFLSNKGIKSAYYKNNQDLRSHNFTQSVPLLISSHSAKGLEFEHVIVFGFDEYDSGIERMRSQHQLSDVLYVTLTRANSNLYIIRHPNTIPELIELESEEEEVLISLDDIF